MAMRANLLHSRYRFLLRPFICYVPLVGGLGFWAWHAAGLSAVAKPTLMAGGLLVWTLIEYLLHRFLLHYRPQAPALLSVVEKLHLGHHRDPQDEVKITVPISGSLPDRWRVAGVVSAHWLEAGKWRRCS